MSLADQVREAGVVGAGGAGFPAHVKAASRVDFIVANGAECEPLMHKDTELMHRHSALVVEGVRALMRATGAREGIIGIKGKHGETIEALRACVDDPSIRLHILDDFYPAGDEYVLVYEATGRLIPPGGIPLDVGIVVQNVETLYNIALAVQGTAVTRKFVTVTGAVQRPLTAQVPLGVSYAELLAEAGGAVVDDAALLVGGPMMGALTRDVSLPVTKTTGGLIVLPGDHALVARQERPESLMHQIGKSACDQCSYCTELCPRMMLGYDVQPHKVMRSLAFSMTGEEFWSQYGVLCSACGLCTLYACPEGLYPREACQQSRRLAREKDFTWPGKGTLSGSETVIPHPMQASRHTPLKQLVRRLGLSRYDAPAPLTDVTLHPRSVHLSLTQHVGAPAAAVVQVGDHVQPGDLVADIPAEKLGARIHASVAGVVREVHDAVVIDVA